MPRPSASSATAIEARLRARRSEIEQEAFARIEAIPALAAPDPSYLAGLRDALTASLDYGLAAIAHPERPPGPVPVALHAQARLAARNGVGLEAVLRRYSAGHTLLADTLLDEAAAAGISTADLKPALRSLAAHYERIVTAVSEEYAREADRVVRDPDARRADVLRRLLAGEPLNTTRLGYKLDVHHVAIVASPPPPREAADELAASLDRRLLFAPSDRGTAWLWFGGRREFRVEDIEAIASYDWGDAARLACGEPAFGAAGWRLSHRQAAAALPVARRLPKSFVRYAEVALLASILQDDLLEASLRRAYLAPLETTGERGAIVKDTLRAYFAAGCNTSSAAAALGVNRRTVSSRITAVEERLGRSIGDITAELEIALRLDALETIDPSQTSA